MNETLNIQTESSQCCPRQPWCHHIETSLLKQTRTTKDTNKMCANTLNKTSATTTGREIVFPTTDRH
jgi:hypothetical protein